MFMGMHFYWFERSGNIDMGRKLFGSFKSLDLGRGITFVFFRTVRNISLAKEYFINIRKGVYHIGKGQF